MKCRNTLLRQKKWAFRQPTPVRGARWIALGFNNWALVDKENFERANLFEWNLHRVTSYVVSSNLDGGRGYLHRFVLGQRQGDRTYVDHKNRNKLDCRKKNLQAVNQSINNHNRIKGKTAGTTSLFKGVSLLKNKWWARITLPVRKRMKLGYFDDEVEAAKAYDAAARKHFGQNARLNFPNPGEKSCRTQ